MGSELTFKNGDCPPPSSLLPLPGGFLVQPLNPADLFTPEDLTGEQRLFGQTTAEFIRNEVLPKEASLYAHDWAKTRELLKKAADLDLLRDRECHRPRRENDCRGSERAAIAVDIARAYTSDAIDRVAHAGKQVLNAPTGQGGPIDHLTAALARVREHPGVDSVGARRRIGDAAIARTRYPFE